MERTLKRLVIVSILLLIAQGIGTVVAVAENLPAEHFVFGSTPSEMSVLEGFLTASGTALSAPLPAILIQAVFTALTVRALRIRIAGTIGLTVLGALYVFGVLGERITLEVLSGVTFDPAITALVIISIVLAVLMLILGVLALARRKRSNP